MNKKDTTTGKKRGRKAADRAKRPAYTRLTAEDVADVVYAASRYVGGHAAESLDDYELERFDDAPGTWFVNVWVGAKIEAEVIGAALRESCAAYGRFFDVSSRYGEFDEEAEGRHAGRRLVYFFVAAADNPYVGGAAEGGAR